jgi:hypothetical protein
MVLVLLVTTGNTGGWIAENRLEPICALLSVITKGFRVRINHMEPL